MTMEWKTVRRTGRETSLTAKRGFKRARVVRAAPARARSSGWAVPQWLRMVPMYLAVRVSFSVAIVPWEKRRSASLPASLPCSLASASPFLPLRLRL